MVAKNLFSIAHSTRFANDRDANLSGIGHFILNLLCNLGREFLSLGIGNLVGTYNHAQFATCLNSIGLDHTRIGHGQMLKVVESLDVSLNHLTTSTRTSARDGIAHLHDRSIHAGGLFLVALERLVGLVECLTPNILQAFDSSPST